MRGKTWLAKTPFVIAGGALIGLVAAALERAGNPPNMGICVVCFERDIAGALGLHRASALQYFRPEIPAFVLGALLAALLFGEFRPRSGSAPLLRFCLGMFAAIGALVFLGCTWRLLLRTAGLDANVLTGLAGLGVGVGGAVFFERRGFTLGASRPAPAFAGAIFPGAAALFLIAVLLGAGSGESGPLFESARGPGALHAPVLLSLGAGLVIGFLGQRTRFCTIGALRNPVVLREYRLLGAAAAFVLAAFAFKACTGTLRAGFAGQPIAHSDHLWNFLGMALAGLAFALGGGCPGRQLVAAGEGNADAGIFVLGSMAGVALAHDLALAAVPDRLGAVGGPGPGGRVAVLAGLVFCAALGLLSRRLAE